MHLFWQNGSTSVFEPKHKSLPLTSPSRKLFIYTDTRTTLALKVAKIFDIRGELEKLRSTYDAIKILRITPSIYEIMRLFLESSSSFLRKNGNLVRFNANTIQKQAIGGKCNIRTLRKN